MRCYTSLDLSTRASVQCGRGYSCLKVTRPSQVFSRSGRYVPPDRRPGVTTLYRGCFVLDILKVDTQHRCLNMDHINTILHSYNLLYKHHNIEDFCWPHSIHNSSHISVNLSCKFSVGISKVLILRKIPAIMPQCYYCLSLSTKYDPFYNNPDPGCLLRGCQWTAVLLVLLPRSLQLLAE